MNAPQDPASKSRRVKPRHVQMLNEALVLFIQRFHLVDAPAARRARTIMRSLPTCVPYTLTLYANEWEIVSRALRPAGSNPKPGGRFARWFALYTLLRKTFVFIRVQRGAGV